MEEKKIQILSLLEIEHNMFTAEIAKKIGLSPPTTAKYLEILKAEGKVISLKKAPYVYWEKKNGQNPKNDKNILSHATLR